MDTHGDRPTETAITQIRPRSKLVKVGWLLLSWTLVLILTAGLGEIAAYIGLKSLGRPTHMERPLRSEFEPWGTWGKPKTTSRLSFACFDVSYRFNDIGARDRDRSLTGSGRWVMLGDSFTEGYGVEEEKRLSNLLEQSSGHEILNFGMAVNFGPLQYLILYRNLASRYEHDGIIVGFLPDNDFKDNDPEQWRSKSRKVHWLRHRPYYVVGNDRKSLSVQYGVFGNSVPRQNLDERPQLAPTSTGEAISNLFSDFYQTVTVRAAKASSLITLYKMVEWQLSTTSGQDDDEAIKSSYFTTDERNIAALRIIFHDLAQAAHGKRKVMLVFPRDRDIEAQRRSGARGSPEFVALLNDLINDGWEVKDLSQAPGIKSLKDLSLGCDQHWNAAAHRAAADFLANLIK